MVSGNYEPFAKKYAKQVDEKPIHTCYERPNTWSLLPKSLKGLRVLDLGCGSGWYAEQLIHGGDKVTAVDVSPAMVKLTKSRLKGKGNIFVANLEEPLSFFKDGTFDIVLAPLVIHYIKDLETII